MRSRALIGWRQPLSVVTLRSFWRSAARWAGADCQVDAGVMHLARDLEDTKRPGPAAYRAMMVAKARERCALIHERLVDIGFVIDDEVTDLGREMARSLAVAARLDRGLGQGYSGTPTQSPASQAMPTAEEVDVCLEDDELIQIPPSGQPLRHRPDPVGGRDNA